MKLAWRLITTQSAALLGQRWPLTIAYTDDKAQAAVWVATLFEDEARRREAES